MLYEVITILGCCFELLIKLDHAKSGKLIVCSCIVSDYIDLVQAGIEFAIGSANHYIEKFSGFIQRVGRGVIIRTRASYNFV